MTLAAFTEALSGLTYEGFQILLSIGLPALLIPLSAVVVSFLLALFSLRDEGMQYAARSISLVLVIGVLGSAVMASVIELMRSALLP